LRIIERIRSDYSWIKGNIRVLIVSYILSGFSSGLYYNFEPKFIETLGASVLLIGVINSVGSLTRAIFSIPGAVIADRYGRRRIIVTFSFVISISYLLYAFAFDWRLILIGTLVYSISCVYLPALSAIEADSIPEERRGEGFSILYLAPGLASGLGPPIAGFIVARFGMISGMRINYLVGFLCVLGIAFLRYWWLEETLEVTRVEEKGLWGASFSGARSLVEVWREIPRSLWVLLLIKLLKSSLMPFFWIYVSLYVLNVIGVGVIEWGIVGSSYMVLGVFWVFLLGNLLTRLVGGMVCC
jgi:MFS family permease